MSVNNVGLFRAYDFSVLAYGSLFPRFVVSLFGFDHAAALVFDQRDQRTVRGDDENYIELCSVKAFQTLNDQPSGASDIGVRDYIHDFYHVGISFHYMDCFLSIFSAKSFNSSERSKNASSTYTIIPTAAQITTEITFESDDDAL